MGRHTDDARRRGIAGWPIITIVALLLVGALTTGYLLLRNKDQQAVAPTCDESKTIDITAGNGSFPAAEALALTFNATAPIARSICLTAVVSPMTSATAADALVGNWTGQTAPAPALWLPDTTGDVDAVAAANGSVIAGADTTPIATSPVVLAVRTEEAAALGGIVWTDLAADPPTVTDGSALRLGITDPRTNRASSYALQSIVADEASAQDGVTAERVEAATPSLAELSAVMLLGTTEEALADLSSGSAGFAAVPVVESDLALYNRRAVTPLAAIYPSGPTAGDTLSAIGITGGWVDAGGREASASFVTFLGEPAARTVLTNSDLRVANAQGRATAPGVNLNAPVTAMPAAGMAVSSALARAIGLPGNGPTTAGPTTAGPTTADPTTAGPTDDPGSGDPATPAPVPTDPGTVEPVDPSAGGTTDPPSSDEPAPGTQTGETTGPVAPTGVFTLVVDNSSTMAEEEDGRTRTSWLQEALAGRLSGAASFGLWTISTDGADSGYDQLVTTGPGADPVDGVPRSEVLTTAVDGLVPAGGRWSYAAMIAAYTAAAEQAVPDVPNRLIVVVSGGDNTPNLPRADVIEAITAVADAGVQLDIIGLSSQAPAAALTAVAEAGNGTFTAVDSARDLAGALETLISG